MKTQITTRSDRQAIGIPMLAVLLLAAWAIRADSPYTSTGWIVAVPVSGLWCTNGTGQIGLRGNAHAARVECANDARLTGRRLIFVDGAVQADGSSLLSGNCYQEVGTWDVTGTNFTATGGLWEISYRGVMQRNNGMQLHLVGVGSGGSIDGLRFEENLARAPCSSPLDPGVPYLYSGTIKPKPLNTTDVADNFDDNTPTEWTRYGTGTYFPPLETDKQFTVRGQWPGIVTHAHADTYSWDALGMNWSVANHQTLEWRVDLVGMTETATNAAAIVPANFASSRCYLFYKGRNFLSLTKWVGTGMAVFFYDPQGVKNTNVVLSLAMTRSDPNLILTARVLDKDNQEAVLYQRSFVDTPQADATLTSAEFEAVSGMALNVVSDVSPPLISGDTILLDAWQYNDGNQPELGVTYDNLQLRTYEVPQIGIEAAVRLTWLAPAGVNYAVEAAPTPQGPWQPLTVTVTDSEVPGMKQASVPANQSAQFFRLVQVP